MAINNPTKPRNYPLVNQKFCSLSISVLVWPKNSSDWFYYSKIYAYTPTPKPQKKHIFWQSPHCSKPFYFPYLHLPAQFPFKFPSSTIPFPPLTPLSPLLPFTPLIYFPPLISFTLFISLISLIFFTLFICLIC